ncbi:MAG: hypothetical protein SFU85_12895 [Candidatus Methylacidiphilales bacterium]|nr:hypothetical protein [Candidatus Methylacidiphilales bacterium]
MTAHFQLPDHHVWCDSLVEDNTGTYRFFYSRCPKAVGFVFWIRQSKFARAVAILPIKPWQPEELVLPLRGDSFWDSSCTHTPPLLKTDEGCHLFNMGNHGNGDWFEHRNPQRNRLAPTGSPLEPGQRTDHPLTEPCEDFPDALMCSHPAATTRLLGGYFIIYVGADKEKLLFLGGPEVHLTDLAYRIYGPYRRQICFLFTAKGSDFWRQILSFGHRRGTIKQSSKTGKATSPDRNLRRPSLNRLTAFANRTSSSYWSSRSLLFGRTANKKRNVGLYIPNFFSKKCCRRRFAARPCSIMTGPAISNSRFRPQITNHTPTLP